MKPSVIADIRKSAMDQSLEVITRRINALGLTEPTIAFTGRSDDEILVQLPGEGDPTRAKSVIQAGGQLQLTLVVGDQTYPSQARRARGQRRRSCRRASIIVPGQADAGTRRPACPAVSLHFVARPDRHRTRSGRAPLRSQDTR